MTIAALIVAAGRGLRAGGGTPKQWRLIAGKRLIDHTIAVFDTARNVSDICIVLHPDDSDAADGFRAKGYIVTHGGADRSTSVQNGLLALRGRGVTKVLIHDAARPCVSPGIVQAVIDALDQAAGAAPALAVTDALWTGDGKIVTGAQDRNGLFRAQTPQGFHYESILAAHAAHKGAAADDVEVALAEGLTVRIVPGDEANLKVTHPADFAKAERYLGQKMDIRTGNGFDVHRFGPGDQVTLCGVSIPFERGLQGHSDADVGMHAITDAIYGALAEGDIGRHFPPSDPQWKGAASEIFLRHAVERVNARGYRITHTDCTLICERPKIGPHAEAMQTRLAEIMQLEPGRVSVKATTSERLGFTGRGEGIAAMATATLVGS